MEVPLRRLRSRSGLRRIAASIEAQRGMGPARERQFDEIELQRLVTIKGGLLKKPMVVESRFVMHENKEELYVRFCHTAEWVCKASAGVCVTSRPLARCRLLPTLFRKALRVAQGNLEEDSEQEEERA